MEKLSHCFSIILSLIQHGIKSLIFLGVFSSLFFSQKNQKNSTTTFLNGFWCNPLFHQLSYYHPKLPRSSTSHSYNQSLQYQQIVIHQLSHMEPSNLISSWKLWSSSLHWWHSYSTTTHRHCHWCCILKSNIHNLEASGSSHF